MNENHAKRTRTIKVKKLDIPEDKIAEYQEAFQLFDKDGGGTISANEIYKIMKSFGNTMPMEEINEIIALMDKSGDGELDFDEFVYVMQEIEVQEKEEEEEEDPIIKAFKFFDKGNTGKISNAEFKYILLNIGEKFSKTECELLFKESDLKDDNGEFDYRDFVSFWRNK